MSKSKHIVFVIMALVFSLTLKAGTQDIFFTPNKGQWNTNINYALKLNFGNMYLEEKGVTWFFYDMDQHKDEDHAEGHGVGPNAKAHCLKVEYVGSNGSKNFQEGRQTPFYYNYFTGKDQSKWKSGIYSAYTVAQKNIYSGIDIVYYGTENTELKYDYHVAAGADASQIRWKYSGAEKMFLQNGELHVKTPLGTLIEKAPYAYQVIDGKKVYVNCNFVLHENEIHFDFPNGYNTAFALVIDPILVFASFSGSTADNFGFSATYDAQKDTYGAGIVYPTGVYPTTAGAFQTGFNGANLVTRDAAISKFSVNGGSLVYSTYLGGTDTDAPHSLIVNSNNELYVLGTTGSSDFPMIGAYDNSFNGGTVINLATNGLLYNTGTDLFVAHFNAGGTLLLNSTFIGGSSNDGLNTGANLFYNYGDVFRGEIIIDNFGNVIVATCTSSSDFPVTGNAIQPVNNGGLTDAIAFRLSGNLGALLWSTYFGGVNADAAYSVQIDSNDEIYITGGTESPGLITTPGVIGPAFSGVADGFLTRFSANGSVLLASTYMGTNVYDQNYFVQLDNNNDVYVVGQTTGNYPVTPVTVYNNPNSGQYIHKLNNTFTTTAFSTRIGRGVAGVVDISPSAFLVNNCGLIYFCGWGGGTNTFQQADFSSTFGLPTTAGAFQTSTDGSDFYLMILSQNATSLQYGTFMGGPISQEHVDGGTSRFDKDGVVYQAVCAGCGFNSDFPTTPGAWSNVNGNSCNLAVFKFDLQEIIAEADFNFLTDFCSLPVSVQFENTSVGAIAYYWDFGDGDTSMLFEPAHDFDLPGTYNVTLIAVDSNTCLEADTAFLTVFIPGPLSITIAPSDTICTGDSTVIGANGASTYVWSPSAGVINPNSQNPIVHPNVSTLYTVIATDTNGCVDTQTVYVHVQQLLVADFDAVFTPCVIPLTVSFLNQSTNGVQYFWDFGNGFTSTFPDDQSIYNAAGNYTITMVAVDSSTCNISDTATLDIFLPPPASISVTGTDTLCSNQQGQLNVTGADTYTWFPPVDIDDPNSANPLVSPGFTTQYGVIGIDTNGCADTAFVTVEVFPPASIDAGPDLIIDIGDAPVLNPMIPGNGTFFWSPPTGLSCTLCPNPVATPDFNTTYYLTFTDIYGCTYVDSMIVLVTPSVFIPNAFTPNGDPNNNVFQPVVRNLSYYEFYIFNRWGQLIFHSTDSSEPWLGTFKGVMCPNDVYVWKIKYSDFIEPDIIKEKIGHVTLVK